MIGKESDEMMRRWTSLECRMKQVPKKNLFVDLSSQTIGPGEVWKIGVKDSIPRTLVD